MEHRLSLEMNTRIKKLQNFMGICSHERVADSNSDLSLLGPDHEICKYTTDQEEIRRYSSRYTRLSAHPNSLTVNLIELPDNRRLLRHMLNDLPTRFLVK
jgi:hypothetical protein